MQMLAIAWLATTLLRILEDRFKDGNASWTQQIADHKDSASKLMEAAMAIAAVTQRSAMEAEANRTRWDVLEKIDEGIRSIALTLGQMMERQARILSALDLRRDRHD